MGKWTDFNKVPLKWSAGNWWVTEEPIRIASPARTGAQSWFQYKYVMVTQADELVQWESGINRIADLSLLNATVKDVEKD